MNIVEVTQNSDASLKEGLISLNKEFLQALDIDQNRLETDIRNALDNQLRPESAAQTYIAIDEEGLPAGMTYFNRGSGIACGGDYIWINAVYVHESYRKTGCGKALMDAVENHARSTSCTILICCRDIDNSSSEKLFEKLGFNQEDSILMQKTL
jgi:GNAT superfamily N-acetyltransferase